jgi:N-acetyl-gamma-glutamyl-phosphate reductase
MKKIKAGIIGGAGYTGGELLRLLLFHPELEISFVQSKSNAGNRLYAVHTDLFGETELSFSEKHSTDIDVLFLCGGHNTAKEFLNENPLPENVVVIDLSQDFRLHKNSALNNRNFIYGLPELNREKIKGAKSIANPGCFATCIQLALLPLAKNGLLQSELHVNATTGSTGAGQSLSPTTHFTWRDNNLSAYKEFTHQHLSEIKESLQQLQPEFKSEIMFIPQRGNFTRGIFATVYTTTKESESSLIDLYQTYYKDHPFVKVTGQALDLKQVVNTNRCFIHISKINDTVLVTSVIDNLLKGASGQAVQNMNLAFGLDETTGLKLKPSAF